MLELRPATLDDAAAAAELLAAREQADFGERSVGARLRLALMLECFRRVRARAALASGSRSGRRTRLGSTGVLACT